MNESAIMSKTTVKQLAGTVGISIEKLQSQMKEAGITIGNEDDYVDEDAKVKLLSFLKAGHQAGESVNEATSPKKITLRRKTITRLKQTGTKGSAVNVEVRKKRVYVKRSEVEEQNTAAEELKKEAEISSTVSEKNTVENENVLPSVDVVAEPQAEKADENKAEEVEPSETNKNTDVEAKSDVADDDTKNMADSDVDSNNEADASKKKKEKFVKKDKKSEVNKNATPEEDKDFKKKKKERTKTAEKSKFDHNLIDNLNDDFTEIIEPVEKVSKKKKRIKKIISKKHKFAMPKVSVKNEVILYGSVTVSELAQKMSIKANQVIKTLMNLGTMATINDVIDLETATLVAEEIGHSVRLVNENESELELIKDTENHSKLTNRSPVVTIMGHVDHGKTSLLDYIKKTQVADGEAGGITQHIGAYRVLTDHGNITFLDTPGHAAFTSMRARGAKVTDIVILVVAADDGVKPQTVEAIQHAKAAEVPLIVAVNKIDKPEADLDRVKNELSQHEVLSEEWGGENMFVNVSALTGEGIEDLLESIILQAEVLELKANDQGLASGSVIESSLDKGRGAVSTILVQTGTLNKGDVILSGHESGRVRAMFDEHGNSLATAGPSTPVVVLGLSGTLNSGDSVIAVDNEKKAKEVATLRKDNFRKEQFASQQASKTEDLFTQMSEGDINELNLVIKADVQGSVEALKETLIKLSNDEVKVKVIVHGVGGINESDATLAHSTKATVIGFNVRADSTARRYIESKDINMRYYSVIYDVIDDVKHAINGMLEPEIREEIIGNAEVRDVFKSPKLGAIAGCMVLEGIVKRSAPIRVLRDNVVIYEGTLESLRRFKDDVNEVKSGMECGIGVKNYNDVKSGDNIEVFERVEIARTI
jgi:translation initiation factor IF-2